MCVNGFEHDFGVKQVFNNGKSQIDPDVIPKIQTISVAKTLMSPFGGDCQ